MAAAFALVLLMCFSSALFSVGKGAESKSSDDTDEFVLRKLFKLQDTLAKQVAENKLLKSSVDKLESQVKQLQSFHKTNKAECPPGFIHVPLVKRCYRIDTQHVNWKTAGQRCGSFHKDAHLAVVDNADKQRAIEPMLSKFAKVCTKVGWSGPWKFQFWLAGQRTDPTTNSAFVWKILSDEGRLKWKSQLKYSNWLVGEPSFGHYESCLTTVPGVGYKWNNVACSHQFCSVCEIDDSQS